MLNFSCELSAMKLQGLYPENEQVTHYLSAAIMICYLTLCILMNSSIWFDTMHLG